MTNPFSKLLLKRTFHFVLFLLFFFPALGLATNSSITVSGNEGAIPLTAIGTFTAYEHCNDSDPPDCWYNNSGTVSVYHNGYHIGSKGGNGSATFSTSIDGGALSQGTHNYSVTAVDSENVKSSNITTIEIDNTPSGTVKSPGLVEGSFDFEGTASFKTHVGGYEGKVYLYIDGYHRGYKYFEGNNVSWSYSDITGHKLDAGSFSQGKHTITVKVLSYNGTYNQDAITTTFQIDNTPEINIEGELPNFDGTADFHGTVSFKEYVHGTDGVLQLYVKTGTGSYSYRGAKSYNGKDIDWTYSEITGSKIPANDNGTSMEIWLKAVATAANGAQEYDEFYVSGKGCPINYTIP